MNAKLNKLIKFFSLLTLFATININTALAQDNFASFKSSVSLAQSEHPTVEQAFTINAFIKNNKEIQVLFEAIPNTYIYANSLKFKVNNANIKLSKEQLPEGEMINDDHYGKTKVFSDNFEIIVPYQTSAQEKFNFIIEYQGCLKDILCYPPRKIDFDLIALASNNTTAAKQPLAISKNTDTTPAPKAISSIADQNKAVDLLNHAKVWQIVLGFIVFGLLLSLTPCVLPMVPIISGIIAGHKHKITKKHAFLLSLVYVLSMSFTYMLAGILVAAAGLNLISNLQHPIVIIIVSILFIILAIASFELVELKWPNFIRQKLTATERNQKGGTYFGVAMMGVLSALIMSPCATAPLAGALLYISSTGNIMLGGVALFCMGFAMGMPVLLFGTSAGHWLPKAGPWMREINIFFGVVFLGLAIYLLSRLIPGPVVLLLWSFLLIFYSVHLGLLEPAKHEWQKFQKALALIMTIYGCLLLAGATQNNNNVFHPLGYNISYNNGSCSNSEGKSPALAFTKIKSTADLTKNLIQAKADKQFTMLTFSADWCVSCRNIEQNVFTDPKIQSILAKFKRLEVDITDYSEQDKKLMTDLVVFNPPTIIFYDKSGNEIVSKRITSEVDAEDFYQLLETLKP